MELILGSATNSTALSRQVRGLAREKKKLFGEGGTPRSRPLIVANGCSRLASASERPISRKNVCLLIRKGPEEFVFSANGPPFEKPAGFCFTRTPRDAAQASVNIAPVSAKHGTALNRRAVFELSFHTSVAPLTGNGSCLIRT